MLMQFGWGGLHCCDSETRVWPFFAKAKETAGVGGLVRIWSGGVDHPRVFER